MKRKAKVCFTVGSLCISIYLVGCDQTGESPRPVHLGDQVKLEQGPIRHPVLTDDQMNRARRLQKVFSEIDPSSLEKWVDDFKRDADPDSELKTWEQIAAAYEAYSASKNLPLAAKRDVYAVLLMPAP